ncbi:endolytic transglycosylase MltG [Parablastomonas sp. CN1-191]|uniref:endolytic transglycosylase MltG n=1 Tax=Parablastomonas sp. CN1-191 TaxID=3400908 RepID=UPI003BF7CD13
MARSRPRRGIVLVVVLAVLLGGGLELSRWFGPGPLGRDASFTVPEGTTLARLATRLEQAHAVRSADSFRLRARVLGGGGDIKAGEFLLPKGASEREILAIVEGDEVLRRFVTVPEGMPAIMVFDRLNAVNTLSGGIAVPAEGSILPDTYEVSKDEPRAAVLARMQAAMKKALAEEWARRAPGLVVKTPEEALTLASIVEKETGKPAERTMVAGLYANRLRIGMPLQADPTIIYPITRGKPLGRRILRSEIRAVNDYNTYSMAGLPKGPITNPGRASIAAVLHPAQTKALYMVADGTGGHAFADTLEQHNANVAKWMAIRRQRGEVQ